MTDDMDKTARECADHAARLARENERLREALSDMLLAFEEHVVLPDANCACHISPPCSDCVNYSFAREAEITARAALNTGAGHE